MPDDEKDSQYYAASVNAWFNTRLEHDKSLLTLSAGGVGLLITLLSTVGIKSVESLILYVLALVSFLVCLTVVLWIFKRNASHLEDVNRNVATGDQLLRILDSLSILSFLFGVLLASIIGVAAAVATFKAGGEYMTGSNTGSDQRQIVNDSFNGATSMRPADGLIKKSFEGAVAMKPAQTPAQTPSPQAPAQSQTNTDTKK